MQRQFDIENEKDMQDLWDILPDKIIRIRDYLGGYPLCVILSLP